MKNHRCAVCGHINIVGAVVCEMCETRLDAGDADARGAGGHDAPGDFNYYGGEPGGPGEPDALGYVPSPRFQGAGDVISPTLAVYRKHFVLVGALVAVTTMPVALLQYGVLHMIAETAASDGAAGGDLLPLMVGYPLLVGLLSFAGTALLAGSLVHAVIDIQRTGAAAIGESLRRGLAVLPKVFLVSLLYAVVTGVGYVLLIIPGVIFSLMYAVAVPAAVAERLSPVESLKRSAKLTDGYKGLIFLTSFVWGILILALSMMVSWSLAYGGSEDALAAIVIQSVIGGMLNSSATVLTIYIFLGLLNEQRLGFETRSFTPGPEAAAR